MTDYRKMRHFCRHYVARNTILNRGEVCKKGIQVRDLVGGDDIGWVLRTPCCAENETDITCDKFDPYSDEELAEQSRELDQAADRMISTLPLSRSLKKEHPEGGSGETECPCCKKRLQWTISSYNGHISMVCETENCVKWME